MHDNLPQFFEKLDSIHLVVRVAFAMRPARLRR
jgi:hypothetical protein